MTLSKDLFGKIPVTSPSQSVSNPKKPPRMPEGKQVFHGSRRTKPEEFLKAPVIHVGTSEQAAHIVNPDWFKKLDNSGTHLYNTADEVPNVHELVISKHTKIHPVTVPDDIANEAHYHFLRERGQIPTETVEASRSFHGVEHPLVKSALNALRQNKVVPYKNIVETPNYWENEYESNKDERAATTSFMVPAPHLNLLQFGEKEKISQPVLPMDYTGVLPKSKKTLRHIEIKEEYPWASDSSIKSGAYD